jgi:hypothetical protein
MKFSDAFKSKFWKASDLAGKKHPKKVVSVGMEDVGDDQKPVMRFDNDNRGLVLNKDRWDACEQKLGPDTEDWVGHAVIMAPGKTNYQGRRVDCICLEVPQREETDDDLNV